MTDTHDQRAFEAAWKICSAWDGKITKPVLRKVIAAYLREIEAGGLTMVQIKPLEWVDLSTGSIAHTPFGIYQARWSATSTSTDRSHEMIIAGGQLAKSYHAGASEAKAAAQADYEQRIISALIPPTLPHVVGWIYEDELPEGYPYDEMYPFSRVDDRRIAELVRALQPFADQAETFDSPDGVEIIPDGFEPAIVGHTIGDLRRARATLARGVGK
jgi:hypothetical protein